MPKEKFRNFLGLKDYGTLIKPNEISNPYEVVFVDVILYVVVV